jgi:predicted nuclease of predicted toxin-antitoxin system
LRLGELPDHEVIRMARAHGRVIITLDRDFAEYFSRAERPNIGIIYLNLPNSHRPVAEINRVFAGFFGEHAASIDLEHALVTVTERTVTVVKPPNAR